MSFSSVAKNQILDQEPANICCKKSILAAFIRSCGALHIGSGGFRLRIASDNGRIIRRSYKLFKEIYGVSPQILVTRKQNLKKNNRYFAEVKEADGLRNILADLGMMPEDGGYFLRTELPWNMLQSECCKLSYLRGTFCVSGSVTDPMRAYHLEMAFGDENYARDIMKLMEHFDLHPRMTTRKNQFVVYFKDAQHILDFLALAGAHNAVLQMEDLRIVKQIRNNVQRVMNCDEANTNKTVDAAEKQLAALHYLIEKNQLDALPPKLKEVALIRLEYPEDSLNEIAQHIGNISRSGVNHRLKKLMELADNLKQREEQHEDTV